MIKLFSFIFANIRSLLRIFLLPICIFLIHVVLTLGLDIYQYHPWFDTPMHFFGGAAMSYSLILMSCFLEEKGLLPKIHSGFLAFFIVVTVTSIAVAWEFAEFTLDYFFEVQAQVSLANTMKDLFLGISGAFIMVCLFPWKQK